MVPDPRHSDISGRFGAFPAPVVNLTDARGAWQSIAVLGMLTIQFLVLALIAWKLVLPASPPDAAEADERSQQIAALVEQLGRQAEAGQRSLEIDAQMEVLNAVVDHLGDGSAQGLVHALEQKQIENRQLQDAARVYQELEHKVQRDKLELATALKTANDARTLLEDRITRLNGQLDTYRDEKKEQEDRIAALEKEIKSLAGEESSDEQAARKRMWLWGGGGLVAAILVALGFLFLSSREEQAGGGEDEQLTGQDFQGDAEERTEDGPSDEPR
jgi:hypothetical protein